MSGSPVADNGNFCSQLNYKSVTSKFGGCKSGTDDPQSPVDELCSVHVHRRHKSLNQFRRNGCFMFEQTATTPLELLCASWQHSSGLTWRILLPYDKCDSKCKSILYLPIISFTRSILRTAELLPFSWLQWNFAVRLCPENWPKITWRQGNNRFTPIANPKLLLTDLKSGCKPSVANLPGAPASLRTYQMDVEGVKTTKPSTFHPYGRNLGLCLCKETFFCLVNVYIRRTK